MILPPFFFGLRLAFADDQGRVTVFEVFVVEDPSARSVVVLFLSTSLPLGVTIRSELDVVEVEGIAGLVTVVSVDTVESAHTAPDPSVRGMTRNKPAIFILGFSGCYMVTHET